MRKITGDATARNTTIGNTAVKRKRETSDAEAKSAISARRRRREVIVISSDEE
jgi:hypothetical protein